MTPPTETEIIAAVIDALRAHNCLALRINSGMQFASYTRKRDGATKSRVIRGAPPGTSDILGCLPSGRFFAIECKRPGHKTKPEQERAQRSFLQLVADHNGIALYDVQSASDAMQGLGLAETAQHGQKISNP